MVEVRLQEHAQSCQDPEELAADAIAGVAGAAMKMPEH